MPKGSTAIGSNARFPALRNARVFTQEKVLRTFYATADAATALVASLIKYMMIYGTPQANRNDIYFFATPERTRPINQ